MSRAAFVFAALVITACVSPLDRVHCNEPTLEQVRAHVAGRMSFAGSAEFLGCFVVPGGFSWEGCALRIDPANFAGLFATEPFHAEGAPPGRDTFVARFAEQHGIVIAGVIASTRDNGPRLFYNAARDRVIALVYADSCGTLREII